MKNDKTIEELNQKIHELQQQSSTNFGLNFFMFSLLLFLSFHHVGMLVTVIQLGIITLSLYVLIEWSKTRNE